MNKEITTNNEANAINGIEVSSEIAEARAKAIANGLSEEVAAFVYNDKRNNKALNAEGLELGNKLTIKGVSGKVTTTTFTNGEVREFINVLTSGDAATVSISKLVGTAKRAKYFDLSRNDDGTTKDGEPFVELVDNVDVDNCLYLPRTEGDALQEILKNHVGTTYKVVGIARECGRYNQTFYLFQAI